MCPEPWAVLIAYLDESGTDASSPAMCVAGLLYERSCQKKLKRKWKAELNRAGVPYFHMREFAHTQGVYAGKNEAFCLEHHKSLIEILGKYVTAGASLRTIPEKEFDQIRGERWGHSQYVTCAIICMQFLLHQASKLNLGKVHFVIANGHDDDGRLARWIDRVRSIPTIMKYHPHWSYMEECSFHCARAVPGLQAADAFAYEIVKYERGRLETPPRKMRKSLRAILKSTDNWLIKSLDAGMVNDVSNQFQFVPEMP
jgi:Protein of unknown function (DUF3800)